MQHNRIGRAIVLVGVLIGTMGQARPPDPLTAARQLYNEERFAEAVKAAEQARTMPGAAAAATVVFSRAHLELFRQSSEAGSLTAARDALKTVTAADLSPRDQVELLIALGVTLYLDDQYSLDDRFSAAAEQFEVALGHAELLDGRSRDLLFDWWANALDRQAHEGPESGRHVLYARILEKAEAELARDHTSTAAAYWIAAGARGVNDLTRASGAAVAGWIRAGALGPRGAALRNDLDRLMVQVILPERARELSAQADPRPAFALLESQWTQIKEKWAPTQAP